VRIGFHAPLPPARTGVADYAATLADALRKHAEVVLNPPRPVGIELYHLGNNQLHRTIYERALRYPGVVVARCGPPAFLPGSQDEDGYLASSCSTMGMELRSGSPVVAEASPVRAGPLYFRSHAASHRRGVAGGGGAQPAAARSVANHVPGARVAEIPTCFDRRAPSGHEVARMRALRRITPRHAVWGLRLPAGVQAPSWHTRV
jgi:hypothetical protein